jgi:proteic killer suppression protein
MIRSFRCKDTQALFETGKTRRWPSLKAVAERKLIQLHAAETSGIPTLLEHRPPPR